MLEVELAFLTVASIMVIGFVGNALFRRTGFPEIPFLLLLGILFGPVLKIFPIEALLPITPYLTYLALIMVLFNGGIEMHLAEIFSKGDRALLLGVLYFFFCTLSAAVIAN
ncbi:MAG: cation:proton antiporter, partial [Candidatus Bathyarchaeia archaeon]